MDSKLSAFPVASALINTDFLPILQNSQNKLCTIGQLKNFITLPTYTSVSGTNIPLTYSVVGISGNCTLPVSTIPGLRILLVSNNAGKLISIGKLPSDGFTFAGADSTIELVWFNDKWNVISVQNMTVGIV